MKKKYIIKNLKNWHYYTNIKLHPDDATWTMYIEKATPFATIEEAEAIIATLAEGYYRIDPVYKKLK